MGRKRGSKLKENESYIRGLILKFLGKGSAGKGGENRSWPGIRLKDLSLSTLRVRRARNVSGKTMQGNTMDAWDKASKKRNIGERWQECMGKNQFFFKLSQRVRLSHVLGQGAILQRRREKGRKSVGLFRSGAKRCSRAQRSRYLNKHDREKGIRAKKIERGQKGLENSRETGEPDG